MLSRLARISQSLGHWLSPAAALHPDLLEAAGSEATEGDLSDGSGFREPPPDPEWRRSAEQDSVGLTHGWADRSEPDSVSRPEAPNWAELHEELQRHPLRSVRTALSRYRQTPGSRKAAQRFRKGIVLDEAA